MENYSLTRDHKTILWISCISIGGYATYRYWKKSKLKTIDESFVQMCKIVNNPPKVIAILGFLHVGKTSIINQMHALLSNSDDDNISHFSHDPVVTRFDYNNCYYDIWEMNMCNSVCEMLTGKVPYFNRKLVNMFEILSDTNLLVFVVDSDKQRLKMITSIIKTLKFRSFLDNRPILIVANTQNDANGLKLKDVKNLLRLPFSSIHNVELIRCQTHPLPNLSEEKIKRYHSSIPPVAEKMFAMATY